MLLTADLRLRNQLERIDTRGSAQPDSDGVRALAKAVRSVPNIAFFNGIDILAMKEGRLDTIELPKGDEHGRPTIGSTEISIYAAFIPESKCLTSVDARKSFIGEKEAELLAHAVLENTSLDTCKPIDIRALVRRTSPIALDSRTRHTL